jgi:hypothetical protein
MKLTPVGQVAPSQLLWTYGPGSLVDMPSLCVLTMGLDRWDANRCIPVDEARLLAAVRTALGPQVTHLRTPPVVADDFVDPFSAEAKVGVPVMPFPRFLRCARCQLLATYDSGLFGIKENAYRPEKTRFVHSNCKHGKDSQAVPARFLLACRNGHLDDFPWRWFAHGGPTSCKGTLTFYEVGASLQTENLWVKCEECGESESMARAFGEEAHRYLPGCRGRHPHLDTYEDCDEKPRAVGLGATNSWFAITLSALAIPRAGEFLNQLVEDLWDDLRAIESLDELRGALRFMGTRGIQPALARHSPEDVWRAIETKRSGVGDSQVVAEEDIKRPEWEVLTGPSRPSDWPHFDAEDGIVPQAHSDTLESVLLLKRLREVKALIGYTRVEAPDDGLDSEERPPRAALTAGDPEWVPAVDVHGEGVFLRFSEAAVARWQTRATAVARERSLGLGHASWRSDRKLDPTVGYPGARFTMLHTFAHLLIRELSLECGYSAASVRERIYADSDPAAPMAGVLIYTASADSDGTLGGLVDLGRPEMLGRLIDQALSRARICSSDPLCGEHDAHEDGSLHGAACHSCTFVSETSCERGNRYLDRALLVGVPGAEDAAFFSLEV